MGGLNPPLGDEGGVNVYFLVFYIHGRDISCWLKRFPHVDLKLKLKLNHFDKFSSSKILK